MANTDRLQPDFNQEPDDDGKKFDNGKKPLSKSLSLSRDIDSLQSGIRVDFDQKLGELADLLARFKALVVSPNIAANDDINTEEKTEVQPAVSNESANAQSNPTHTIKDGEIKDEDITDVAEFTPADTAMMMAETARFENGLYKLNSQLYRFRLELDQEMEFREEPLHIHFRQQSELSMILQKINDRSSEKHPDN